MEASLRPRRDRSGALLSIHNAARRHARARRSDRSHPTYGAPSNSNPATTMHASGWACSKAAARTTPGRSNSYAPCDPYPARELTRIGSRSPPRFSKPIRDSRPKLPQRRPSHSRRRPISGRPQRYWHSIRKPTSRSNSRAIVKGICRSSRPRKPHGATGWNPFIELGDQIRTVTGQIPKVECTAGAITGFEIGDTSAAVQVSLPDPSRADRRR
jgi:hypothetical protein